MCLAVASSNQAAFSSCLPSQRPLLATNWVKRAMASKVRYIPAPPISVPSARGWQKTWPISRGSKSRGCKNWVRVSPVFRVMMAESILVPAVLYKKWVPGW